MCTFCYFQVFLPFLLIGRFCCIFLVLPPLPPPPPPPSQWERGCRRKSGCRQSHHQRQKGPSPLHAGGGAGGPAPTTTTASTATPTAPTARTVRRTIRAEHLEPPTPGRRTAISLLVSVVATATTAPAPAPAGERFCGIFQKSRGNFGSVCCPSASSCYLSRRWGTPSRTAAGGIARRRRSKKKPPRNSAGGKPGWKAGSARCWAGGAGADGRPRSSQ